MILVSPVPPDLLEVAVLLEILEPPEDQALLDRLATQVAVVRKVQPDMARKAPLEQQDLRAIQEQLDSRVVRELLERLEVQVKLGSQETMGRVACKVLKVLLAHRVQQVL